MVLFLLMFLILLAKFPGTQLAISFEQINKFFRHHIVQLNWKINFINDVFRATSKSGRVQQMQFQTKYQIYS